MKLKPQQFSGLAGVVLLWLVIPILMVKAHVRIIDTRPISYLGIDPHTMRLFNLSLIISAVLFVSYSRYVAKHFHVNGKFLMIFFIGQLGQMITAVTPYGHQQPARLIHTLAAYTLAFSLPLLIGEFTRAQTGSPHSGSYHILLRLEQLAFVVGIGLFAFTKGIAPLGEALPAIGFHIWIITITILSLRPQHEVVAQK